MHCEGESIRTRNEMAPQGDSLVRRATVCLTCGDKGDSTLLIYCRKCLDSSVHHYCMDNVCPDDDNIYWLCWDCAPKDKKDEPLRTSERISSKRLKVLENRNYWKERLNQNSRLVRISDGITEAGQLTTDCPTPILDMETQLLNERQHDLEITQEEKFTPEISSHSGEHNESVKTDEFLFTKCNLSNQNQEVGKKKRTLILNDGPNSEDEGRTIDITSNISHREHSLEPDDCPSAEPVVDPIWRGWFNITQESETCVEILAHLSNKACLKVSDAATAIPSTLDIQVLDKRLVWPGTFTISPPTAASIALYFFPACDRDERVFDILLDEVIEGDLALKAMINNVELLIFSSRELPVQHWRFKSKYFLWGVFRQKQRSRSSTEATPSIQGNSSSNYFTPSEIKVVANKKDLVHSEPADHLRTSNQPKRSPLSMNSSQASSASA